MRVKRITRAPAPATDPVGDGWRMYRRVAGIYWPDAGRKAIGNAVTDLYTALDMYGRLDDMEWPEMITPLRTKWASKAAEACVALVAAVRLHCGQEDAEYVEHGTPKAVAS